MTTSTAQAIGHASRELQRGPWELLALCLSPFAAVATLAVALVVYGRELAGEIRENGWRDFDKED